MIPLNKLLEEFFHLRLDYYEKRRRAVLQNLEMELLKLDNKVRFLVEMVEGKFILKDRKRAEQILELKQKGFTCFPKKTKASDYDYLFSMPFGLMTFENVQELCNDMDRLNDELDELRRTPAKALWAKDLDALEKQLDV